MGKKSLPLGSCQNSGIMQSPRKYNTYFLQISKSVLVKSIESQCSSTDVYSMPLLIIRICFLLPLIFIQCSETTLPDIKGGFELQI